MSAAEIDKRDAVNYVSMGRNPNSQPVCNTCAFLERGSNRDGGWCTHPNNRVPPMKYLPNGFTPSVASTGGCDLHPETRRSA